MNVTRPSSPATRPVCPTCGSTDLYIQGFLGYAQPYDARLGEYSDFDVDGNSDFPTGAFCTRCNADVTSLLREHGVLVFYKVVPEEDSSQPIA